MTIISSDFYAAFKDDQPVNAYYSKADGVIHLTKDKPPKEAVRALNEVADALNAAIKKGGFSAVPVKDMKNLQTNLEKLNAKIEKWNKAHLTHIDKIKIPENKKGGNAEAEVKAKVGDEHRLLGKKPKHDLSEFFDYLRDGGYAQRVFKEVEKGHNPWRLDEVTNDQFLSFIKDVLKTGENIEYDNLQNLYIIYYIAHKNKKENLTNFCRESLKIGTQDARVPIPQHVKNYIHMFTEFPLFRELFDIKNSPIADCYVDLLVKRDAESHLPMLDRVKGGLSDVTNKSLDDLIKQFESNPKLLNFANAIRSDIRVQHNDRVRADVEKAFKALSA